MAGRDCLSIPKTIHYIIKRSECDILQAKVDLQFVWNINNKPVHEVQLLRKPGLARGWQESELKMEQKTTVYGARFALHDTYLCGTTQLLITIEN